jgi:hypothetical protein
MFSTTFSSGTCVGRLQLAGAASAQGGRLVTGATNRAINELVSSEHRRVAELVTELERQGEELVFLRQQIAAYSGMHPHGDSGGVGYDVGRRPRTAYDEKRSAHYYRPDSAASAPGAFPEGALPAPPSCLEMPNLEDLSPRIAPPYP